MSLLNVIAVRAVAGMVMTGQSGEIRLDACGVLLRYLEVGGVGW